MRLLAGALLGYAVVCAAAALVLGPLSGRGWAWLVYGFVVTNTITGSALAVAGWPIARYRPRNPIGWLLLLGGCGFLSSSGGLAVLAFVEARGGEGAGWRLLGTVVNAGFPWPVAFCLPLALLLFPDGRFPSRAWRLAWIPLLVGLVGLLLGSMLEPTGSLAGAVGFPDLVQGPSGQTVVAFGASSGLAIMTSYVVALAALAVRYRRGNEQIRRQILWVLLAVGCFLLSTAVSSILVEGDTLWGVVPLALIPLAMSVAVLRHQLLDIRLVVARSLLYTLFTAGVLVAYSTLVVMVDWVFRRNVPGAPAIAALAIAIAFTPVRTALQGWIDRLLYGARLDPVRALSEVRSRLGGAGTESGLDVILETVCHTLRLPAAGIEVGGEVLAMYGDQIVVRHVVPLRQGDQLLGNLVIGLRAGEERIADSDDKVIGLLAGPLAVAAHAVLLTKEVEASRERVVSSREEERRRLRRDLHDGLGPRLTGVVLNADAARHLLVTDPGRAAELLDMLRDQASGTVDEIRRLVYDLRPPSLDGMGLAGALDAQALTLTRRLDGGGLHVRVELATLSRELPAAVEVAAFRIVTEALTNVVRHSSASTVTVRLESDPRQLRIEVRDDGASNGVWQPGLGLNSIRERAAELRGTSRVGGDASGGLVRVVLPLVESAI